MYTLRINEISVKTDNWEKTLNEKILRLLDRGIPVTSVSLDGDVLINFHVHFGERPYYKTEHEFRNTKLHKALNESLYVILYQFYDDRGKWYMKRFNQLQKGIKMITEALE